MSALRLLSRSLRRHKCFDGSLRCLSNNVVSSPVADVEIPNILLQQYMLNSLDKWHDKIAVECAETRRKLTYSDVKKKSDALSGFLQRMGLKKGDAIAVVMTNVPEYFVTFIGCIQAGLVVSTINPVYTSEEIKRQLINCNAKLVFTMSSLYPTVKSAVESVPDTKLPIIAIQHTQNESSHEGAIKFNEACDANYEFREPDASPEDVTLLPYSSGTTGLPKGVQLTHRNLVANYVQMSTEEFKFNSETSGSNQDVVPVVLPMFHLYGLMISFNLFAHGVKFVTLPKFSIKQFANILTNDKPSILHIVPPIVLMLLNIPELKLSELKTRTVISAAAPLGAADIDRFRAITKDNIDLLQLYGMTECSPVTHQQTLRVKNGVKIGGSGMALPNTLCKVVDLDDPECKALGPKQDGELLIKGPQVMKGYLNNEKANKDIFVGDGWLRTGDVAHYDEDGHFFITDRLKELIKVKGFQVAPAELEELLRSHHDVKDAAVIGVPDDRSGEVPRAFVVLKEGAKTKAEEIKSFVAGKVVDYKQLAGGLILMDAIPKTASGKILRRELRNGK